MVPTGTGTSLESPSRPDRLLPSPCRPRSASCSGLKRKCSSVLWCSLATKTTSPPRPPSPPLGPPRGTNFSRRNARQPLPPSPAFTRIRTSSMNMGVGLGLFSRRVPIAGELFARFYTDELAEAAAIAKHDNAENFRKQGIVLAAPNVLAGLVGGATLPHQNGAAGHGFAAKGLHAQPLGIRIAPVLGTA